MEEWKVGDWLEIIDFEKIYGAPFLCSKGKYKVIGIDSQGIPYIKGDNGTRFSFYRNEMEYIRKVESPFAEPKIDDSRLIEILKEVNEQLTEENGFKDRRIKLLEEELLATKTRYLKLATQFDVKKFKDEN